MKIIKLALIIFLLSFGCHNDKDTTYDDSSITGTSITANKADSQTCQEGKWSCVNNTTYFCMEGELVKFMDGCEYITW